MINIYKRYILNDIINNMIENNNYLTEIYLTEGITFSLILFGIYLEINPKLGNIWYRKNEKNIRKISIPAFLQYFKQPFKNKFLWYPRYWDLNPYMFTTIITTGFITIRKYFDHLNF